MADAPKEKWTQWVALTTTILAVCAAISSLKAGSYSTKVQLATSEENNGWSYFQAKSIKQHTCEAQRDLLGYYRLEARTLESRKYVDAEIAKYTADIARYDNEKSEIKMTAERATKDQSRYKKQNAALSLAVMLLQIAIMLSSISALAKRPPMWYAGLVLGMAGLVYMANGFYLWF
jgi:hypothetical protein